MGRAGVVRGWRGLGVNGFDLVGWSGATLLGEVGHRDHQNPKGEQYSKSEWCSDQKASIHFVPSHCYAPPDLRKAGLMRFESVTIAAGETRMSTERRQRYPHARLAATHSIVLTGHPLPLDRCQPASEFYRLFPRACFARHFGPGPRI